MGKLCLRTVPALLISLILLLPATLLPGCSCGVSGPFVARGWVLAGVPVTGATLTIYDLKGKEIFTSNGPATGEQGSFMLKVDKLPADFRIVASGGQAWGETLEADLSAELRKFDRQHGIIHINPVTTMISTHMSQNPRLSLESATQAVKHFLEIPDWVDTSIDLAHAGDYFHVRSFMVAAENSGGLDQFISSLLDQLSDPKATQPFPQPDLLRGPAAGAAKFVAEGLVKGAFTFAGGKVTGWGLSKLGLGLGGDDGTADILEQLNEMQEQMSEMRQQLDTISGQLTSLSLQVRDLGHKLSAQISRTNYELRETSMATLISQILQIRELMALFVTQDPADPDFDMEVMQTERNLIMGLIERHLLDHQNTIHDQQAGIGFTTPLMKVWSEVVASSKRFLGPEDSAWVRAQFEYFDHLQLWHALLLVEYYHVKALDTGQPETGPMYKYYAAKAEDAITTYVENREIQAELLLPPVPDGYIFDRDQSFLVQMPLFYGKEWEFPGYFYGRTDWFVEMTGVDWWVEVDGVILDMSLLRNDVLFDMFNAGGADSPLFYAIDQGFPSDDLELDRYIRGWGEDSGDLCRKALSLQDGTLHFVEHATSPDHPWASYLWAVGGPTFMRYADWAGGELAHDHYPNFATGSHYKHVRFFHGDFFSLKGREHEYARDGLGLGYTGEPNVVLYPEGAGFPDTLLYAHYHQYPNAIWMPSGLPATTWQPHPGEHNTWEP